MKENVINYTTTKTSNIFFDEGMSVCGWVETRMDKSKVMYC